MTTPDPTTITILGGMITALGTAIGVQWKTTMSHLSRVERKLDECERDRVSLWARLAELAGRDVDDLKKGKS